MGEKHRIPFVQVGDLKIAQRCTTCKFGDSWSNTCIACMMGRKAGFKLADKYKGAVRGEEEEEEVTND